jgi:hypothetical protein
VFYPDEIWALRRPFKSSVGTTWASYQEIETEGTPMANKGSNGHAKTESARVLKSLTSHHHQEP